MLLRGPISQLLAEVYNNRMGLLEAIDRLDRKVAASSEARREKSRQKKLGELMEKTSRELASSPSELGLVKRYVKLRREYRRLLSLRGNDHFPISESPWVKEGGNEIESQFHDLRQEINQIPSLIKIADSIDSFLPFF